MTLDRVILHFGAHKTGTSLIQKYLRDNLKKCHAAGIWFMPRSDGNVFIGWGGKRTLEHGLRGLKSAIDAADAAGARYYIISHENSLGRPIRKGKLGLYPDANNIRHLHKAIGNRNVRIIYYIREQAEFLQSYYLQTIHEGGAERFKNFVARVDLDKISWLSVYAVLCDVFGAENVALRYFDDDISQGQSRFLLMFFRSVIDTDLSPFEDFKYQPIRNPSISWVGLRLSLFLNPLLKTRKSKRTLRYYMQKYFSNSEIFSSAIIFCCGERSNICTIRQRK